jgi:hypothetical protein
MCPLLFKARSRAKHHLVHVDLILTRDTFESTWDQLATFIGTEIILITMRAAKRNTVGDEIKLRRFEFLATFRTFTPLNIP